ncbi:kinase-like protein [Rhizoctonia solani]|uniref:Kinase-like protein n=1 Tax=Rhizoctonia solani TaxID=456999 RepID=A0A8H7M0I2_9AGAM|nr:kinase-like protein [Rhizoctonia solani]
MMVTNGRFTQSASHLMVNRWHPVQLMALFVSGMHYSPLGDMIASGSKDQTIRLWNASTNQQIGGPLTGHHGNINSVVFLPKGNLIASGSDDKTIRLWDTQKGMPVSEPLLGHSHLVCSVSFSPDGARIASGSYDKTIRIWDIERKVTIVGPLQGHTGEIESVSFSPDGPYLVSGSDDKTLSVWDIRAGRMAGKPYESYLDWVMSVAFSPNRNYVASGSLDHTIRIWDIRTNSPVDEPLQEHREGVYSVSFSPCGRRIASGSSDKKVLIWNTPNHDTYADSSFDYGNVQMDRGVAKRPGAVGMEVINQHSMDTTREDIVNMTGGGFGDIWKGELQDGTIIAIKTWRSSVIEQFDYKTLKRAAREVHFWSRMRHTNVHELMGVVIFKDRFIGMVSEWMENGNIYEYTRRNPQINRFQMCAQVASGLDYMHKIDAVHGDLKGLNVLVSSDGVAKLADFGLSTMAESSLEFSETSSSQAGSIRWAAPELLSTESPKSKQSDVYALGMTMLEIVTGSVPYAQCQRDFSVMKLVEQGVLPIRPTDRLQADEFGDRMWSLLVGCWGGIQMRAHQLSRWSIQYVHSNQALLVLGFI